MMNMKRNVGVTKVLWHFEVSPCSLLKLTIPWKWGIDYNPNEQRWLSRVIFTDKIYQTLSGFDPAALRMWNEYLTTVLLSRHFHSSKQQLRWQSVDYRFQVYQDN